MVALTINYKDLVGGRRRVAFDPWILGWVAPLHLPLARRFCAQLGARFHAHRRHRPRVACVGEYDFRACL